MVSPNSGLSRGHAARRRPPARSPFRPPGAPGALQPSVTPTRALGLLGLPGQLGPPGTEQGARGRRWGSFHPHQGSPLLDGRWEPHWASIYKSGKWGSHGSRRTAGPSGLRGAERCEVPWQGRCGHLGAGPVGIVGWGPVTSPQNPGSCEQLLGAKRCPDKTPSIKGCQGPQVTSSAHTATACPAEVLRQRPQCHPPGGGRRLRPSSRVPG